MRHFNIRSNWIGLLMIALALSAAACSGPAGDAPDATVEEAVEIDRSTVATNGIPYTLSADSRIDFVGAKVTGTHDGGFKTFSGTIMLVDNDPALSSIELNIDATSLWTDTEKLTGHLKSADFFDVETHPTATFTSTAIVANDHGGFDITGNLNLHGVEKSITFPATIVLEDGKMTTMAEFAIQRFDFDIVYAGMADNLIKDEVLIRFNLIATPAT